MNLSRLFLIGMAALAPLSSEAAGKPGGSGGGSDTPTGTIYFEGPPADGSYATWAMTSMKPDGSEITTIGPVQGPASRVVYGGARWFVSLDGIPDETYPDGTPRVELCAFREDWDRYNNNNLSTRVQLTDNPTLQPWRGDWMPDRVSISFVARRWSSSEPGATIVEGGIYTAQLALDGTGALVGLAEQPLRAILFPLVEWPDGTWPDLAFYSWDPTCSLVAYSNVADDELRVADLFDVHTTIYYGLPHMPVWSPGGGTIAFGNQSGICTIQPDGRGLKRIIRNTSDWSFVHAYYSPDGQHLVFMGESFAESYSSDLFRATAAGRDLVNLTNTPDFDEMTWEWFGGWVE